MPITSLQAVADAEIVALYDAVGWTAYTRTPDGLLRAVRGSTWSAGLTHDGLLIGLVRVLSDDLAIAWLQDILVHPAHQRCGHGRALFLAAQARFAHVRTFALMTDDRPEQHAFYAAMGLHPLNSDAAPAPYNRLHAFAHTK